MSRKAGVVPVPTGALRALFLSEGALGIGTSGHARVEPAIREGLVHEPDVEARFATLPPMPAGLHLLARGVPGLRAADLDLQVARYHLVQALRARRLLEHELGRSPTDAVHVVSHSIALGMVAAMRRLPVLLSVDVSIWEHRAMALWAPVRRHSRAMTAPSRGFERRALAAAALVLPWTEWARRGVERECPETRVVVHHPGLDLQALRPAPRRPRDRLRVLFVGGRFVEKGGEDLIAAIDHLGADRVEVDLVTQQDVAVPARMRLHRSIGRPAVVDLLQQADLVCLPSHADAAPWTVLEAMACGAAVVATAVGAVAELLGEAGVTVPPRDPRALATAIESLLGDDQRRDALGTMARRRVEERYDARRQAHTLIELMRTARAHHQPALPPDRTRS